MSGKRSGDLAPPRGFTLVEAIVVLVMLSLAAVAIVSLQGGLSLGRAEARDTQVGSQLIQECAELVLAKRRSAGFDEVRNAGTDLCSTLSSLVTTTKTYERATSSKTDYTGSGCPSGASCLLVTISQGGLAPVNLLLVK